MREGAETVDLVIGDAVHYMCVGRRYGLSTTLYGEETARRRYLVQARYMYR